MHFTFSTFKIPAPAPIITNPSPTTTPRVPTTAVPTTEPFQTDSEVTSTATSVPETSSTSKQPTSPPMIRQTHVKESDCFRHMYGSFEGEIIIIGKKIVGPLFFLCKILVYIRVIVNLWKLKNHNSKFKEKSEVWNINSLLQENNWNCDIQSDLFCFILWWKKFNKTERKLVRQNHTSEGKKN